MGWLDVYSIFSCHKIFDPWNTHFAGLIAFNEYVMQPGFGFNMHPHEDVEQIFIVTEGMLTHADSLGNEGILGTGGVQSISAGNGYARYAWNKGDSLCRYLAAWFTPNALHLPPHYSGAVIPHKIQEDGLIPLVSGNKQLLQEFHEFQPLSINCNATLYTLNLTEKEYLNNIKEQNWWLIYVTKGILQLNHETIHKGGHARIEGKEKVKLSGEGAEVIIISMWK